MLKQFVILLAVVAGVVPPPLPNNEGHFFYFDMNKGGPQYVTNGSTKLMKYVNMLIGDYNQSLSLSLNTMETDNFIFSGHCENCSSPVNFTLDTIKQHSAFDIRTVKLLDHYIPHGPSSADHLVNLDLNYTKVKGTLKLQVSNFQRETSSNFSFQYVTNSSKPFHSPYDGFIGISPGINPSTMMVQNSNFISELLEKGMIDNPIVSIYTRNEFGNSSIIKFGGWDVSALMKGTTL